MIGKKIVMEYASRIVTVSCGSHFCSVVRLEPDSVGSLDPYSDPDSQCGSKKAKIENSFKKSIF
jgi:hypothetical protein